MCRVVRVIERMTNIVGVVADVREQVADQQSRFAARLELPRAGEQVAGLGELDSRFLAGVWLAIVLLERGLVIKRIDLRRPAVHEQEDDALGLRLEVRRPNGEGSWGRWTCRPLA